MPEARVFRRAGRGKSAPPVRRGESGSRYWRRPLSYSTGSVARRNAIKCCSAEPRGLCGDPRIFDDLTKVPQVFRNPGGSPALQNERHIRWHELLHGLLISIEMPVRIPGDRLDQAACVGGAGRTEYFGGGPAFYDPPVVQDCHPVAQGGDR
jgi:hypothetical protein